MKKKVYLIISIILLTCQLIRAQQADSIPDTSKTNNLVLLKVIGLESMYYAGAMLVMQNTWYKDREVVPFHFYNDNKGYLQVDKFGHAFGSYVESYIGYYSLRKICVSKTNALIFGGSLGLVLQTPIEIMDGIHEGWGFSWGDMAANAIGSGIFISQELLFDEQIVKYKFSYWESTYSQNCNGFLGKKSLERLLKDYNGHTYWLSVPVNKIISARKIPDWFSIAAGYGANGMYGEYENITEYNGLIIPETKRIRQYFLSLDIDWSRIKTNSRFLKTLFTAMTFIKLPFPALEINSEGKVKAYALYF